MLLYKALTHVTICIPKPGADTGEGAGVKFANFANKVQAPPVKFANFANKGHFFAK